MRAYDSRFPRDDGMVLAIPPNVTLFQGVSLSGLAILDGVKYLGSKKAPKVTPGDVPVFVEIGLTGAAG